MTVLLAALGAAAVAVVLIACWDVAERIAARRIPQADTLVLAVERGTDHDDATAEEVLAVFDELKAQRCRRITTVEDDEEIVLPWLDAEPVPARRRGGWWPAPPVPGLVLVRCPAVTR